MKNRLKLNLISYFSGQEDVVHPKILRFEYLCVQKMCTLSIKLKKYKQILPYNHTNLFKKNKLKLISTLNCPCNIFTREAVSRYPDLGLSPHLQKKKSPPGLRVPSYSMPRLIDFLSIYFIFR